MLSLESTSSRMSRLAKQELYFDSFFSLDEMLSAIDAVGEEEVQALIHRLLDEEQLSMLTLGPLDRRQLPRELRPEPRKVARVPAKVARLRSPIT